MDKIQEIRKALESSVWHLGLDVNRIMRQMQEWLSYLLTELDETKEEAEKQRQIRYNATEANTVNLSKQAEEIERLRGAIDELFKNREKWREHSMELEVERASSIRKLEQAVETLEWYAEEDNYRRSEEEYHQGYPQEIMWDKGIKARKALSFIREGESK